MKKISVITPCFNSEKTLLETLNSVSRQTYESIEHIVIDGLSSDQSVNIAKKFHHNKEYVFKSELDQGIYDAINKGIRISTGEIVTILNSDDLFSSDNLIADIVKEFDDSTDPEVIFGDIYMVDRDNIEKIIRYYSGKNFQKWKFRFGLMPPHPGSFIKKRVYERYGLYLTNYKIAADFELFLRFLFVNRVRYLYLNKLMAIMRMGGVSTKGFKGNIIANYEIVKACKINGLYTNLFFLALKIPFKIYEYVKRPNYKN